MPRTPEGIQRSRKRLGPMQCRSLANDLKELQGEITTLKRRVDAHNERKDLIPTFNLIGILMRSMRRHLAVIECCVDENSTLDPSEVHWENVYGEKSRMEDAGIIPEEEK